MAAQDAHVAVRDRAAHRAKVSRARRDRSAEFIATEPESGARLELEVEHGEKLELARRALGELDDAKREVFVLAVIEQMSAKEIAEVLSVPMNTVYSRLRAARAELPIK